MRLGALRRSERDQDFVRWEAQIIEHAGALQTLVNTVRDSGANLSEFRQSFQTWEEQLARL